MEDNDHNSGTQELEEQILRIDHHGLVAAMIEDLELVSFIDSRIPKESHHQISHGQAFAAMIHMCLAFENRRLYKTADIFEEIAVHRLFGPGVQAKNLNEFTMGRTLDAIFDAGPTKLFTELAIHLLPKIGEGQVQRFHADTTSISVYGEYQQQLQTMNAVDEDNKEDDLDTHIIEITYGYSKAHRPDLKQFIIGLITNQHGIPFMMKAESGNASDKTSLNTIIQHNIATIQQRLSQDQKIVYIADSAFYTTENIQAMGSNNLFISHAPSTLSLVKRLELADLSFKPTRDKDYKIYITQGTWAGIKQTFAVIHSEMLRKNQLKTFEKKINKEEEATRKKLKKACAQWFFCEKDARSMLKEFNTNNPLFEAVEEEITQATRKIETKEGERTTRMYKISATLQRQEQAIKRHKDCLGRFVLATNDRTLDGETILKWYKEQDKVEKNFQWMKESTLRVSDVFLKKPERIMALVFVMVSTLIVHNLLEYILRKKLQETNETVKNIKKQPTQTPTVGMIFFQLRGIYETAVIGVESGNVVSRRVSKLNERKKKIIDILGGAFKKFYR